MRRAFSILLMLFLGLGPLTALLPASDEARLPACCRRNGAHHCDMALQVAAMGSRTAADSAPGFSAPTTCPNYPGCLVALLGGGEALAPMPVRLPLLVAVRRAPVTGVAIAVDGPIRPYAGRGPPADLLN